MQKKQLGNIVVLLRTTIFLSVLALFSTFSPSILLVQAQDKNLLELDDRAFPAPLITDVFQELMQTDQEGSALRRFPKGRVEGGDEIVILGRNFRQGLEVKIGEVRAEVIDFDPDPQFGRITLKTPVGELGYQDVVVINPDQQESVATGAFAFGVTSFFSVGGTLDSTINFPTLDGLTIKVKNLETGNQLETITKNEGRYQLAYADFNNGRVAALGDELQITAFQGKRPVGTKTVAINEEHLRDKALISNLTLGRSASQLQVSVDGVGKAGQIVSILVRFQDDLGNDSPLLRSADLEFDSSSDSGVFYYLGQEVSSVVSIQPGQPTIELRYLDGQGQNASITVSIFEQDISPKTVNIQWNRPPTVATVDLLEVQLGEPLTLTISQLGILDPDSDAQLEIIDSTQGSNGGQVLVSGDRQSLVYTPQKFGLDQFTFSVSDGFETIEGSQVQISVLQPELNFTKLPEEREVAPGEPVRFEAEIDKQNLSSTAREQLSYLWDFGDGSEGIETSDTSVQHVYELPGEYVVTVIAELPLGPERVLEVTAEAMVMVNPKGIAFITQPEDTEAAPGEPVQFAAEVDGAAGDLFSDLAKSFRAVSSAERHCTCQTGMPLCDTDGTRVASGG